MGLQAPSQRIKSSFGRLALPVGPSGAFLFFTDTKMEPVTAGMGCACGQAVRAPLPRAGPAAAEAAALGWGTQWLKAGARQPSDHHSRLSLVARNSPDREACLYATRRRCEKEPPILHPPSFLQIQQNHKLGHQTGLA